MGDSENSDNDILLVEKKDGIWIVTLNRPEIKNVLGIVLLYELYQAVGRAIEDENVKGVILTGARHPEKDDPADEAFSSGGHFDLKEYEALEKENEALTRCFGTADFFEALSAMKEKREPSFKGA